MYDENTIRARMKAAGQTHLLDALEGLAPAEQASLLKEMSLIDFTLFACADQATGKTYQIEPIPVFSAERADACREDLERTGLSAIRDGKVGAVLLCGGQGTRLGFDHAKGMYDIGVTRPVYIFERHFSYMKAVAKRAGTWFPVYIMTSVLNGEEIRTFLDEHDYFGYERSAVRFYVQNMVPSTDFGGKILMRNASSLVMSPDGNGGWFSSLVSAGLLEDVRAARLEWFNVVSIDNVLQRTVDPMFVGATLLSGMDCGAQVIKKAAPDERIGLICQNHGHPSVIEYYELDKLIKETALCTDGIEYGVILNYLFKTSEMERTLTEPLPVHKACKKIPYFDGQAFITPERENGYKYEMLATDLVEFMKSCLPYEVRRAAEFAPVKNHHGVDSVETARAMLRAAGIEI